MIVFIIPLKSAQVSKSWERVSKLFERCVKSVCNQTSSDFRVIVVCHERPDIEFSHPNITYIEVNFPVPNRDTKTNLISGDKDKNRKIWIGLSYTRQLKPSHIMFVDADDCISKRLVEFVNHNYQQNGWFIDRGYVYEEGSKILYLQRKNFHKRSGTSHIVEYDLMAPPNHLTLEDINDDFLFHQHLADMMQERGTPLDLLPFIGAVYVTETGENLWGERKLFLEQFNSSKKAFYKELFLMYARRVYKLFHSHWLTQSIRNEFGLYDIQ